jgi:23S rRNA pseudouridine1911/1915/1917 synthase
MAFDHLRGGQLTITVDQGGERLDRLLAARVANLSRSRLKMLIVDGQVAIDGGTIRDPAYRVNAGERIALTIPPAAPAAPEAESIPLHVVYEDDELIVIDKPRGLVVHPAAGHWTGTLVNALIAHCGASLSGVGGVKRPGIVHRLDKDTTGLLVVAKTDRAHQALAAQFADHGRTGPLERGYLAFVWGVPDRPKGTIEAPIGRHPHARDKMAVRPDGRPAVTHWQVVERYPGPEGRPVASLLDCRLETGRTHQIRVHLAHLGHPLLGDSVYGPGFKTKAAHLTAAGQEALAALARQALHAYLLGFKHPISGESLLFRAELPADLVRLRSVILAGFSEPGQGRGRFKDSKKS